MNKKGLQKYDLTSGGILNKLLLISLPVIGTQVIQMTYNLADMFWLGRIGSDAVAASGSVGMYMWMSMAFLMFGRLGAEIGVSQNLGRGERDTARMFGQTAVQMSVVIGLFFGLVMIVFSKPLIGFYNFTDTDVIASAESYLRIVAVGIPFTFLTGAVTGVYNGSGNSRIPFFINALGLAVNMVLDPILILKCGLGVEGAAIATIVAQILACLLSVLALLRYKGRPFEDFRVKVRPEAEKIKTIIKWATPTAVESFLFCFLTMATSRMIAAWGESAFAAQRVSSQVESLTWLIAGGYSTALTSFIGQNYGARKTERIRQSFRISTAVMIVWGLVVTAVLAFGGDVLMRLFVPGEDDVIEMGKGFLRILATCQLIACLEGVAAGAFRGEGRTMPPSIASVTANALRVLGAFIMSKTSLGLNGIIWAVAVGAAVRGGWMYIWYIVSARRRTRAAESEG